MHKKNLYPAALDFQLKRKKRERRKKKEVGLAGGLGSLTLLDLAAGSRRPWVWFFLGFRMIKSQKGLTFPP
jgi:hypothetical protein